MFIILIIRHLLIYENGKSVKKFYRYCKEILQIKRFGKYFCEIN